MAVQPQESPTVGAREHFKVFKISASGLIHSRIVVRLSFMVRGTAYPARKRLYDLKLVNANSSNYLKSQ